MPEHEKCWRRRLFHQVEQVLTNWASTFRRCCQLTIEIVYERGIDDEGSSRRAASRSTVCGSLGVWWACTSSGHLDRVNDDMERDRAALVANLRCRHSHFPSGCPRPCPRMVHPGLTCISKVQGLRRGPPGAGARTRGLNVPRGTFAASCWQQLSCCRHAVDGCPPCGGHQALQDRGRSRGQRLALSPQGDKQPRCARATVPG